MRIRISYRREDQSPPAEEILAKAADILEEGGWCRKAYENIAGEHCLRGALYTASRILKTNFNVHLKAERALEQETGHETTYFNDHRCTSQEEAISALRNAKRWLIDG